MLLDIVVFGIPILFGLLVAWLGIRRSLLSLPVRILVALLIAWLASSAASVYIVSGAHSLDALSRRMGLPPVLALSALGWIIYLLALLVAFITLSRIRSRALQNATHSVGVVPTVSRFVVGAACGLLIVLCLAVPSLIYYQAMSSDPNAIAGQFQGSLSFPLLKSLGDRARRGMEGALPSSLEAPAPSPTP